MSPKKQIYVTEFGSVHIHHITAADCAPFPRLTENKNVLKENGTCVVADKPLPGKRFKEQRNSQLGPHRDEFTASFDHDDIWNAKSFIIRSHYVKVHKV